MHKKLLSLLLSCFLVFSAALPGFAQEAEPARKNTVILVNAKSLERLAENCRLDSYSEGLVVSLGADLDLTGSDFQGIPIFCGEFQGNGHTIRGLHITRDGSQQGFFRYLIQDAAVYDLHLEGTVEPAGTASQTGGFAGSNSGLIQNCSFSGSVSGKEQVGGIAGSNAVTGRIENCRVSGKITGGHFVGGMAGQNAGTVRSCENHASINETAWQNQVSLSDITLESMMHSEAANTVTDVGGIAGISTGMIRSCVNAGRIGYPSMGYNIGGIAGTQSGTLLDCENRGEIFGRKEVGGIVGQLEPSAVMTFQEDALQILTRQLEGMGQAVSKASSNLQGSGEQIIGQISSMYGHIQNAKDAVQTLIPDPENPVLPDADTIQAAKNNIGSSLRGMSQTMEGMGATAYSVFGKVSGNLYAINDQINAMRSTVGNISETLGGNILDRSDEDTETDFAGKVANCRNLGNIQGDLNCGGIAGAMAMENDLDLEEDLQIRGENSLNFESELRAVIRSCENSGSVAAGKQNAGGIVGLQSLGLVKDSLNTGKLDAEKADYVGGISGRSMGFIRSSHANGLLLGNNRVGGISGAAAVVTDCYALVQIENGTEKLGAILGDTEETSAELDEPISGNYYLAVGEDPGAIDGISYEGQAQPLKESDFFRLETLPDLFRQVSVTFRYSNGTERTFTLDFGKTLPEAWIPPIPPREGRQAYWEGLSREDMSAVYFDTVFEQAYTNQKTVLESPLKRNEIPVLLVQGVFPEEAVIRVQTAREAPSLESGEELLEAWNFQSSDEGQSQIRLQLPAGAEEGTIRILLCGGDGIWRQEPHHVLGRYAVASLEPGDRTVALIHTEAPPWGLLMVAAAAALFLPCILIGRKRKKN